MLQLIKGRPIEGESIRLDKELMIYNLLDDLQINYERVDHTPVMTLAECDAIDEVLDAQIVKNLFLCDTKNNAYYLLIVEGHKKFNAKQIARQIGAKGLSFGKSEALLACLDLTPGAVSVMGLVNDKESRVQLLIDKDLLEGVYIGCHPCVNTTSIRIRIEDLIDVFLAEIEHIPIFVEV